MTASLCIVTYNNKDNIIAALSSIYKYTKGAELTVYIVDNNSTDGTPDIIAGKFPQVQIIRSSENKGFGSGHNLVLPQLRSEYHFIVNPDIKFTSDIVTDMCRFLSENPDIAMAVPKFLYEDGSEQFTPKLTPKLRYMLGGRLEKFGGYSGNGAGNTPLPTGTSPRSRTWASVPAALSPCARISSRQQAASTSGIFSTARTLT